MRDVQRMRATWASARAKEAAGRLDAQLRRQINSELSRSRATNGNMPHPKAQHGYAAALDILAKHGIQVDQVVNTFQFEKALTGTVRVELAFSNPADPFSPQPITNSLLVISYAPFGDTGASGDRTKTKFETVAYLS